jgi:hypothetical protein
LITVFSVPKPSVDEIGLIQSNAVRSWVALAPDVQVVLVGGELGTAEMARKFGAEHIPVVMRSEQGTPLLDDAFARVDAIARHPILCFANCDIILLEDFLPAVRAAARFAPSFLMVGETRNLAVSEQLELGLKAVRASLQARALREGRSRGATAIDYFVFTAGLFDPVPPFVVGRARFDNWLVWRARQRGVVIDASAAVVAVHEQHDYDHVDGGADEAHFGVEAERNLELAGGKGRLFTIYDASHRLSPDARVRRHLGAIGRTRENARKIAWKLSSR